MSTHRDRRADFKRTVYQGRMPDSVKVLLLRLLDDMNHKLIVSVPRSKLAADLGVPMPRISERTKAARDLGYLSQVRRGRPGVTAVYQGLIVAAELGTPSSTCLGTESVSSRGTDSVPPEVRPDHTQVVETAGTEQDCGFSTPRRGSDEEEAPGEAASRLTACEAHGWADCLDRECLDARARRTA